jgi:carboxypeptidase D
LTLTPNQRLTPRFLESLIVLFGLAACNQNISSHGKSYGGPTEAYVRLPSSLVTDKFVDASGFIQDHIHSEHYAFGYLQKAVLDKLPQTQQQLITELNNYEWTHFPHDLNTLRRLPDTETTGDYEEFHDFAAMTADLEQTATRFPEITYLEPGGLSVQGRELWLMKISAHAQRNDQRPKILLIANMHGDETVGRELMLYLIRMLTQGYQHDERITRLVNAAQIFIMPSMNPDGFELGQRYNARDVDLNRNFPDFVSDPHDTPANRAPETQAIMALHASHHFIMALNFHGGEVCFNVPWDTKSNARKSERFGDDGLLRNIGRQYADLNATMRVNHSGSFDHGLTYGYEWYRVKGGMQDWSIFYRESTHATVELSHVKWPSAAHLPRLWDENREGIIRYMEQALVGMHLHVVDRSGATLHQVNVRSSGHDRSSGNERTIHYASGVVHRPSLTQMQTLEISAPGYKSETLNISPWQFTGSNYRELVLSKD